MVLSKFGFDTPDEFFSPIYLYFNPDNFSIFNPEIETSSERLKEGTEKMLLKYPELAIILSKLFHITDTKIDEIIVEKTEQKINNLSQNERYSTFAKHPVFSNNKKIGTTYLSLEQQSKGSQILFALGGFILYQLKLGGLYIIDEIDTSLHPKLAKTLIQLFQNKISNPKNTQIIFSTHETAFLDKDFFRKDQIWFTEKNEYGETELFSAQDFDKVREDTPFEKWYMAGKFGGIPDIQSLETIFTNGTSE